MINVWSVIQFLRDAQALSEEDCERIIPFCSAACAEVSNRLRRAEYGDVPAVTAACAGVALYRFTLVKTASDESFESMKAGDITVSRSAASAAENASRFRDEALLAAAAYLTDVDFVFEAVNA